MDRRPVAEGNAPERRRVTALLGEDQTPRPLHAGQDYSPVLEIADSDRAEENER